MHQHTCFTAVVQKTENCQSVKFWMLTVSVTLTLTKAIPSFHKQLWLTLMYNQIKFVGKRISSSEYVLETVIVWLWALTVTLTLTATQFSFFLSWMFWWYATIPSLVTKCQKAEYFRRYLPDKTWTDGHSDSSIYIYIYTTSLHNVGAGKRQKQNKQKLKNSEACKSVGQ